MKSALVGLCLVAVLTPTTYRVEHGAVRVICPMTIGGSFDVKTTALSGSVTTAANSSTYFEGSLNVDLRTLDTGIGLRNEHLRENYLEVSRGPGFDTATLSQIRLNGLDPEAPVGKGSFTGLLTLHGITKSVTGAVDVRQPGVSLRVSASFPVELADYDIRPPRYLGVGVRDTVQVEVTFAVTR